MLKSSTILHLRFPFSLFLLPIYLFALSQSQEIIWINAILCFAILHFFVYPASNGFNSYFDKDEGSIGGLKVPPKVTKELYWSAITLDVVALILSLYISWQFFTGILIYGLVSKAYSHPSIRLKKYPILGWLTIGIFQGFLVYIISFSAINGLTLNFAFEEGLVPAALCTLLLLGSYPMTQIYQHQEDHSRGDITISLKLGIRGTFHFTAGFFAIASVGFFLFFMDYSQTKALLFLLFLFPTITFFGQWYLKVRKNPLRADFLNTMKLNLISSVGLSLYFLMATFFPM